MSEHTDRGGVAMKQVVYHLAGMQSVPVHRDLTFHASSGAALPMDLYYPPPSSERPFPVVIMPMAYPDPEGRARGFGPLTSWAQLMAASGMAAVVYGTDAPAEDVHALVRHLRSHAASLGLDPERFGLFAASANVTVALAALMRDSHVKCAALLYGCTLDGEGSSSIADLANEMRFVNACAGMSVANLPADVPMLFVRAGQDHFAGLNDALDRLLHRAVARNLPVWFINHATGRHGFDLEEESPLARGLVQQVLAFLRLHLTA